MNFELMVTKCGAMPLLNLGFFCSVGSGYVIDCFTVILYWLVFNKMQQLKLQKVEI